jgi:ribonuclease HI
MALTLTLMLVAKKRACKIKVFEDSQVMIKWMKGGNDLDNFMLRPTFEEIQIIRFVFNVVSFQHIFR